MNKLNWFKRINAKITSMLLEDDYKAKARVTPEQWIDIENIFWRHCWFGWIYLLIPIAGPAGFFICVDEANKRADWEVLGE